jgi:hypothetical protein
VLLQRWRQQLPQTGTNVHDFDLFADAVRFAERLLVG